MITRDEALRMVRDALGRASLSDDGWRLLLRRIVDHEADEGTLRAIADVLGLDGADAVRRLAEGAE